MNIIKSSLAFFILFAYSDNCFSQTSNPIKKEIRLFDVNPVIDINKCIKWHVDFSQLKNTVLYKDHLISMGLYGGFVAIDTNLTAVDKEYSKKLNSDLFTNIAVRNDTLFAEKYNQIYYLNDKNLKWFNYQLTEPIALFEILYEDDKYVFFPITQGEWGSMLFIYDKRIKQLRAIGMSENPQCLFYQNGEYYIIACLYLGGGSSSFFKLENMDKINIVSKDNSTLKHFQKLPVTEYPELNQMQSFQDDVLTTIIQPRYGINITSSFFLNNNNYYFTYYHYLLLLEGISGNLTYITKIVDKDIVIVDSTDIFHAKKTISSNNFTIIESYFRGYGFYLSHNNVLYQINFGGIPDYEYDYKINKFFLEKKLIPSEVYKGILNNEPPSIKFEFNLAPNITLNLNKDNGKYKPNIRIKNKIYRLKLYNEWNFLDKAFNYKNNNFIFFSNSGNVDHKYGLIEIYDLNRFIDEYCEKE